MRFSWDTGVLEGFVGFTGIQAMFIEIGIWMFYSDDWRPLLIQPHVMTKLGPVHLSNRGLRALETQPNHASELSGNSPRE